MSRDAQRGSFLAGKGREHGGSDMYRAGGDADDRGGGKCTAGGESSTRGVRGIGDDRGGGGMYLVPQEGEVALRGGDFALVQRITPGTTESAT